MKIFLLLFLLLTTYSNANLIIDNEFIHNNFKMNYFVDEESKLNIKDISKTEFKNETKNNYNIGYKKGTIWFKIEVLNQSDYKDFIFSLNEVFYETANIYYYENDNWIKKSNSIFTLIKDREVKSNHIAFDIKYPKNESSTFFIELKGKYAYFGNLVIYEKSYFHLKNSFGTNILYTFSLGIVLALILFTLFLYIKTSEKIYLYYILYCLFNFIYFANIGGLLVYIDLQEYIYKLQLAPAFMIAFLILFSNEYLEVKSYLPKFDKILKFLSLVFFTLGILVLFSYQPWNKFINNFSGLAGILLIVISIIIFYKGNTKTKYYTFAMLLYFAFIFMFSFMVNGTLEYTFINRYGIVVVNAIEMMIFSYILANRYHLMNESVKIYLENEVNQRTSKLNELVKERETLLKEVYHRVKNNFHMLIGMMHLQNSENTSIINRIKSMSVIHEQLYNSKNISKINISKYLEQIIINTKQSNPNVLFEYDIKSLTLDFEMASSLGIIVNEIVTNSIKHNQKLNQIKIDVNLYLLRNNIYLIIKDNGNSAFNPDEKGLGLKLIKQFSNKLPNSEYSFSFENGTSFELKFKSLEND